VDLRRLSPALGGDLRAVLARGSPDAAACHCTAHYRAEAPAACRDRLLADGVSDGYLLYEERVPVAWCQCAPWTSFPTLARLPVPTPDAFAVTCLVVVPEARGRGLAHLLLRGVVADLRARRVPYVVACAHRLGPGYSSPLAELPESVCVAAGFRLERDDRECPIYGLAP
jgi:ribosomal protein S18 acetylase RimI-like enzyme